MFIKLFMLACYIETALASGIMLVLLIKEIVVGEDTISGNKRVIAVLIPILIVGIVGLLSYL